MTTDSSRVGRERENKYLTFSLNLEEYGIEILKVKEIIGLMEVTKVPRTPSYVKGVINLRGKVIPVIDLRLKFGMDQADYDQRTCIIVVEVAQAGAQLLLGVIVDSVSEVANLKPEDIEAAPDFGGVGLETGYILGMAKSQDKVRILMDIDRVVGGDAHQLASL